MKIYKYLFLSLASLIEAHGHTLHFQKSTDGVEATFKGSRGSLVLNINVGASTSQSDCAKPSPNKLCFQSIVTRKSMTINNIDTGFSTVSCQEITRENPDSKQADCIQLGNASWYGGHEMRIQRFPITNVQLGRFPYVTNDFPLGAIMESLWFNSEGYIVFVDRQTPLFLSFNKTGDGNICLSASYDEYPYKGASQTRKTHKELKYTLCSSDNVREAFQYASSRWISKPVSAIDPSVVTHPIWSTWARYKKDINATTVIDFAKQIAANGFSVSHLEIDDNWETCYGELEFDSNKFPDPAGMVTEIKSMGFNVSLWIHPYINVNCPSFKNPEINKYLLKNSISGGVLQCHWWNGIGGYLDTTNVAGADHFVSRVTRLRDTYGIDTFKFDSGETGFFSPAFLFDNADLMATPNDFTRLYADTASRLGNGVEVRVAYNSQKYPIFLRMMDKDSNWDYTNGLKTLIPSVLHMSIIGYPFILPDMIGGNNYRSGSLPDRELFVRWLQINVFMPALQFSIAPWDYDQEVINISKNMVALHEQYAPLINKLAEEAVQTGNPIVRPLWWVAPTEPEALEAEQQYLLGNNLLVAPIVDQGAISRDIYLPRGKWEDQILNSTIHVGPIWLRNYKVNLDQLPYFIRRM